MKVMVIGGTGHIGRFLVPMLIEAGCDVVVVTSGRTPIRQDGAWAKVTYITCQTGQGKDITPLLSIAPDVAIELPGNAWQLYQQMKNTVQHIIACGSLWMFGLPKLVPTPEQTQNTCVFDIYEKRYQQIQSMIEQSQNDQATFTAIMPPNICGPGKIPIDCLGGRDLDVHKKHAAGKEVILPEGADVLISPCDAEDVAQCFLKAALNRDKAAGQIFNVGSQHALTATQLVQTFADIYNVDIPIKHIPWPEYTKNINPDIGAWWHFKAHMCPDITKAKQLLGYKPKFTSAQSLARAVDWMCTQNMISINGR